MSTELERHIAVGALVDRIKQQQESYARRSFPVKLAMFAMGLCYLVKINTYDRLFHPQRYRDVKSTLFLCRHVCAQKDR